MSANLEPGGGGGVGGPIIPGAEVDLGAVIRGLVASILAWASVQLLRPLIDFIFGQLPGVGGWLVDQESRLLGEFILRVQPAIQAGIAPLGTVIQRLDHIPRDYMAGVVNFAYATYDTFVVIRQHLIPEAEGRANAHTDQAVGALNTQLQVDLGGVWGWIQDAKTEAEQFAEGRAEAASGYATNVVNGLRADTIAGLQAEHAFAGALLGAESAALAAGLEGEAAARDAAVSGAVAVLGGLLGAEQAARVGGLAAERAYADQLGQAAHAYTDQRAGAVAVSGAAALGAVAVAVRAIEDSPCMQRCDTLGGLGAAIEAIDLAALLGLVALCIEDPPAATEALRVTMVPIVEGAESAAQGLVGVAFPGRA